MDRFGISSSHTVTYGIVLAAWFALWVLSQRLSNPYVRHKNDKRRSPPGPKRKFLIRNVLDFPPSDWFVRFSAWQKIYGDIIYLEVPGIPMLVLHDLNDVEELMVKRAPIYSNKPDNFMVKELMQFSWAVVQKNLGEAHNEMRKVFRKVIGPRSVGDFDSLTEGEATMLQKNLASVSGDPEQTIRNAVSAAVIKMAYGERIYHKYGAELTRLNVNSVDLVTWVSTQLWLVNIIPITRFLPGWFPGLQFPKVAARGKDMIGKLRYWAFGLVKEEAELGQADLSVVSKYLNEPEFSEESLRDSVALMYMPATDTTSTALCSLFSMLLMNPVVQKKLQKELDSVLGDGRAPKMVDLPSFPYLRHCWVENLRLHPPAAIGVPRSTAQEDEWKGYIIPKGTMIVTNIGFMMRDPRVWGDDAEEFKPERFLPEVNPRAYELPDASTVPFGFGRRICPGRYMAERTGLLFAATVLSAYTIVPPEGEILPPSISFGDGFVRKPVNLRCRFIARL